MQFWICFFSGKMHVLQILLFIHLICFPWSSKTQDGNYFQTRLWVAVIRLLSAGKVCSANVRFGKMMWKLPKAPLVFDRVEANVSGSPAAWRDQTAVPASTPAVISAVRGSAEPTGSEIGSFTPDHSTAADGWMLDSPHRIQSTSLTYISYSNSHVIFVFHQNFMQH